MSGQSRFKLNIQTPIPATLAGALDTLITTMADLKKEHMWQQMSGVGDKKDDGYIAAATLWASNASIALLRAAKAESHFMPSIDGQRPSPEAWFTKISSELEKETARLATAGVVERLMSDDNLKIYPAVVTLTAALYDERKETLFQKPIRIGHSAFSQRDSDRNYREIERLMAPFAPHAVTLARTAYEMADIAAEKLFETDRSKSKPLPDGGDIIKTVMARVRGTLDPRAAQDLNGIIANALQPAKVEDYTMDIYYARMAVRKADNPAKDPDVNHLEKRIFAKRDEMRTALHAGLCKYRGIKPTDPVSPATSGANNDSITLSLWVAEAASAVADTMYYQEQVRGAKHSLYGQTIPKDRSSNQPKPPASSYVRREDMRKNDGFGRGAFEEH